MTALPGVRQFIETKAERRDWLAITLADHIARIDWLRTMADDIDAGEQVAEHLLASWHATHHALDSLRERINPYQ